MKLLHYTLVCLLAAGTALGQSKKPASTPPPTLKPRPTTSAGETNSPSASSVPPDAPVVTVQGLCEKPANSSATPADCKTVITRAEFEKVVNAVQPNMAPAQKKQFVERYVTVLVLAEKAHDLGLDQGPDFDEQMYLSRIQILARFAGERIQKDAAKVSDGDIDDYYKSHAADFKTLSFQRLYVPKQKQMDTTAQKPNDPELAKKREESEAAMKEEADKLHTRAAAGEDFAKLQQEAYDFANYKMKAQNTRVDNVRKSGVPPTDAAIFELKKGDVSEVFNNPTGFMVYKIEDKQDLPLTSVREEIARALQAEQVKKAFDQVQSSAKTMLDETYFAVPAPPSLRAPGEAPAASEPPAGKK